MIKVNLATRKQSGVFGDSKNSKANSFGKVNLDQVKDLPLRKLIVPIVVCFLGNYMLDGYKEDELKKLDQTLSKVNSDSTKLQNELNKLRGYDSIKKTLDADEITIKTKLETIQKLIADRSAPPKILVSVATMIPKDVWLSELKTEKLDITMKGSSLGFNQISDFMKSLNESAYFMDVDLKNSQQSKDSSGDEFAVFELKAKRR
jgi:Tfp pilus assembly protein PilN